MNFAESEMDKGEYVRFMYHRAGSNALHVVRPRSRTSGWPTACSSASSTTTKNASIPVTDFEVQIDWYENADWDWVTTPGSASVSFAASIDVPSDTPYGQYSGAIVLTQGNDSMVVPVSVAVAATVEQDDEGALTGALEFGGADVAEAQANLLYNNGSVFGANDWTWRAEAGDWRFFFLDVPEEPAEGSLFLARTEWDDEAPYTDIDTLIMGRSANQFQIVGDQVFGAPYVIDTVGRSPNTHIGSGIWIFDTATDGAEDFVAGPAQEGLHALVLHQVGWQGDKFHTPFSVSLGSASVAPSSVDIDSPADTGSFDVTFTSSVDLDGLSAEALRPQPAERHRRGRPAGRPGRPELREHQEGRYDRPRVAADRRDDAGHAMTLTCSSSSTRTATATSRTARSSGRRRQAPRTSSSNSLRRRTATTRSGCRASPSPARQRSNWQSTRSRATT